MKAAHPYTLARICCNSKAECKNYTLGPNWACPGISVSQSEESFTNEKVTFYKPLYVYCLWTNRRSCIVPAALSYKTSLDLVDGWGEGVSRKLVPILWNFLDSSTRPPQPGKVRIFCRPFQIPDRDLVHCPWPAPVLSHFLTTRIKSLNPDVGIQSGYQLLLR